jgi:tetratricopeptide (TPR) repeat protein
MKIFRSMICQQRKSDSPSPDTTGTNLLLLPATNSAREIPEEPVKNTATNSVAPHPASPEISDLRDVVQLDTQGKYDEAIEKLNLLIQADPQNPLNYGVRGQIYSEMKQWDKARKDYETILQLNSKNTYARFNLSELKFRQRAYADARAGFLALESDPDLGDLASYKVFLCDLLGGQEATAQAELNAFNQTGSNPSYYFSNAAWYLFHKQPDQARYWLGSGVHIYLPKKAELYLFSLKDLGYLPLPPPAQ